MTPRRRASTAAAAVAVLVLAPLLAGCAPTAEKVAELERLAQSVEGLSFVSDATVSTSQPLPYSLTSTMTIALEPQTDRAAIDELHDLLCAADTQSSPEIVLEYGFRGGAVLTQDSLGQCWSAPVGFVDMLPVLAPHEPQLTRIAWTEESDPDDGRSLEIDIDLVDDPAKAGTAAAATIGAEVLAAVDADGASVSFTTGGITIPTGTLAQARATVALVADLASRFPVARLSVDETRERRVFVELATDRSGAADEARAYLASEYPDVVIAAVVDSTEGAQGSPDQSMLDAGAAVRLSGVATAVTVGPNRLTVSTTSMAANVAVLEALREGGYGEVDVAYSTALDGGAVAYLTPGRTPLNALHLADATAVVAALLPTGKLAQVAFTPGSLKVYLTERYYDDASSVAEFSTIMRDTIADDVGSDLRFVELDNKPLG